MNRGPESAVGEFSQRAATRLRQLGWDGSASRDSRAIVSELEATGFAVNEAARAALERFGGLEFHILEGGISWIRFDMSEARHTLAAHHIDILANLLSETPCPIGSGSGYIVFVCPSGKAAILHEQWFCLLLCDSLAELFEVIVFGDRSRCREFPDIESCRPD